MSVRERFLTVGPFTTRYLEAGDPRRPPLVLLHDGAWGGSSSVTWGNIIPALAEHYWVLAPDLLGFGGSDKAVFLDRPPYESRVRQVEDFLEVLVGNAPVHMVGCSFGGTVALRMLASSERVRFRSVTSIGGSGGPWRSELAFTELGHWDGSKEDLRRIAYHLIDDSPLFETHLEERLRWASVPGHFRAVMSMSPKIPPILAGAKEVDDWPTGLSATTTPLMLVSGTRDMLLDPEWTTHFTEPVPHVVITRLESSHEPNIDAPELLLPVLFDFLVSSDS